LRKTPFFPPKKLAKVAEIVIITSTHGFLAILTTFWQKSVDFLETQFWDLFLRIN
jgi:hypothetical protein